MSLIAFQLNQNPLLKGRLWNDPIKFWNKWETFSPPASSPQSCGRSLQQQAESPEEEKSRIKLPGTSCSGLDSPGEVTPEQLLRMPHAGCCHPFFIYSCYSWPMHQLSYLSTFRLELCDERIFMKYIYSVVRVIWLYWFSPRYLNQKVIYSYLFLGYKVLLVHMLLHQSTISPRVALH